MRFEADVRFWIKVDSLEEGEKVIGAAQLAAYEALGTAAIDNRGPGGGMCRADYHGLDDEAVAALTEDDGGEERSSMMFRATPDERTR